MMPNNIIDVNAVAGFIYGAVYVGVGVIDICLLTF